MNSIKNPNSISARVARGESCVFRTAPLAYGCCLLPVAFTFYLVIDRLKQEGWGVLLVPLFVGLPFYPLLILLIRQKLELFPDRLRNQPFLNPEDIFNFRAQEMPLSAIYGYRIKSSKAGHTIVLLDQEGKALTRIAQSLSGYQEILAWVAARHPAGEGVRRAKRRPE